MSNDDTSREESDEQPSNMPLMPVTFDVPNDDRSREASLEQPSNMPLMLST